MPVDQYGNDLQTITPVTEVHRDECRDSDASQGAQGTPDASRQGVVQDPQIQTGMAIMPSRPAVNIPNIDQTILNTGFSPAGQELNARNLLENPNLPTSGSSHPSNTPDTDFSQTHRDPSSEMHETSETQNDEEGFSDVFSELMTGTEHEVAFLTRYFSEYLGPWYVKILCVCDALLTTAQAGLIRLFQILRRLRTHSCTKQILLEVFHGSTCGKASG